MLNNVRNDVRNALFWLMSAAIVLTISLVFTLITNKDASCKAIALDYRTQCMSKVENQKDIDFCRESYHKEISICYNEDLSKNP